MSSGNNLFFSETIQNLIFIFRFRIYLNFKLYRYSVVRTYIIRNESLNCSRTAAVKFFLRPTLNVVYHWKQNISL